MLHTDHLYSRLESNSFVFRSLLMEIDEDEIRFREGEAKWNLLEVVCHLYDEEREDFRARLQSVLDNPTQPFTPIDPVGWVTARNYAGRNFKEMVEKFLDERVQSVSWLKSLNNPKWENTYNHPSAGAMSGLRILSNWIAHDYLHIRQITRIKYHYLQNRTGQDLSYAGELK